jgi:hypothetical protein
MLLKVSLFERCIQLRRNVAGSIASPKSLLLSAWLSALVGEFSTLDR